jgi:hypothetical protein
MRGEGRPDPRRWATGKVRAGGETWRDGSLLGGELGSLEPGKRADLRDGTEMLREP